MRVDPFADAEPKVTRHERFRRGQPQIVAFRLQAFPHLQHVTMAFGGEQPYLGALAFKQSVGRHGRAVDNAFGLTQQVAQR